MDKTLFTKRLRRLRRGMRITQEELGYKLGVNSSTVSCWERGLRIPEIGTMSKLADFFDVSVDYLVGNDPGVDGLIKRFAIPLGKTVRIPVLGVIRAGEPIGAEENIIGWEDVPVNMTGEGQFFGLRVQSNSMSNSRILPGDTVIVRFQQHMDSPDDILVVCVNGEEATLKRCVPQGDLIILYPDSPGHKPQVYRKEEVRIIGKVVEIRIKAGGNGGCGATYGKGAIGIMR